MSSHTRRGRAPIALGARLSDIKQNCHALFATVLRFIAEQEPLRAVGGHQLQFLLGLLGHIPATLAPEIVNLDRPLGRGETEYEPARRLAVLLLESFGLLLGGTHAGVSFQVDLARLFERSVECAVQSQRWMKPPEFQRRPPYEGDMGGWSAIDALIHRDNGPLVVDAKYSMSFSKDHLYQVLAYMKMMNAEHGALVYPTGADLPSRRYRGHGVQGWQVTLHELDPIQLSTHSRAELERLGEELADL